MEYRFSEDIKFVRELLGISQSELADMIGVEQVTVSRCETGKTVASGETLEKLYSFAFDKNVRINKLKEMLLRDNLSTSEKILFHGAKGEIDGAIDIRRGRANNDFGQGFYAGESYEQALSFVAGFDNSSVYYLSFNDSGLKCKRYEVNQDWMMTIAYYREKLREYEEHPYIKELVAESRDCDYIIAPIADNRMFQIINSFINGEITDEQCRHCLAATNLGMQYIFISDRAASKLSVRERCYIAQNERKSSRQVKADEAKLGEDKVKLARIEYRGKGLYIDEILG
ncbi:MAG: DUF3990 domain-containing protein [Clostridia bacterium]|nr:DUF3990 domain-containing protein [Clostridia bacterium]